MNQIKLSILYLAGISLVVIGCRKDPVADLPANVNLGESVVFLNGELATGYEPIFMHDTIYKHLNFSFVETKNNGQLLNAFGFGFLSIKEGDYILHTERIQYKGALTSFSQTVSEDLEGYSYELVDAEEGFFKIETLDTINMEVSGRFKAKFRRTSKNGNGDLDMPKRVIFEGVFNEKYTH